LRLLPLRCVVSKNEVLLFERLVAGKTRFVHRFGGRLALYEFGRVAQPSASHRTSLAPRIDLAGAASFAFFFSAKGAGLDAPLPNSSRRRPGNDCRCGPVDLAFMSSDGGCTANGPLQRLRALRCLNCGLRDRGTFSREPEVFCRQRQTPDRAAQNKPALREGKQDQEHPREYKALSG
jgi:hypothetical protein